MKKFIVLSIVLLMLAGFAITLSAYDIEDVDIDIKPGSCPNSINLKSKGVVPVAVLTTASFDATTVDPETVTLSATQFSETIAAVKWAIDDVDGDLDLDLLLHFSTQDLAGILDASSIGVVLMGETYGGETFMEWTSVVIVQV